MKGRPRLIRYAVRARRSRAGGYKLMSNSDLDARLWLRHACATLAYRGGKVVRDAPEGFGRFSIGAGSRTPSDILAHICDLFDWALSLARGQQAWHDSTPRAWDADVERFFRTLGELDAVLAAGPGPLPCPWTRLFAGPIADAFTHIGQLAMLRRIAGSPVKGENYYKADIEIGRVGSVQPLPAREFD
jgi:hypothetical protein